MDSLAWTRLLRGGETLVGILFVGLAFQATYDAYHPVPGHIDGRGLFTVVIIPPLAAIGGLLIVHAIRQLLPDATQSNASLLAYPVGGILALTPSISYILWFSGSDVSKQLTSYIDWFIVAFLLGMLPVGYRALRPFFTSKTRNSNRN